MVDVPANLVLTLIRTVGEAGATEREKYAIGEIAKHFEKTGASQLASYARSQIGEEPVWVPMEAEPIVDDGNETNETHRKGRT